MAIPLPLLLIEDEAVLALDLRATLLAEGYAVVGIAASGPRALATVSSHSAAGSLW